MTLPRATATSCLLTFGTSPTNVEAISTVQTFNASLRSKRSSQNSEAKKRFALCVLDYIVTSNHIHLPVKDTGEDVIAQSTQLIARRTAQET